MLQRITLIENLKPSRTQFHVGDIEYLNIYIYMLYLLQFRKIRRRRYEKNVRRSLQVITRSECVTC